jgi:hypothetical protein
MIGSLEQSLADPLLGFSLAPIRLYYSVRSIDHVRQLDDQRHEGSL